MVNAESINEFLKKTEDHADYWYHSITKLISEHERLRAELEKVQDKRQSDSQQFFEIEEEANALQVQVQELKEELGESRESAQRKDERVSRRDKRIRDQQDEINVLEDQAASMKEETDKQRLRGRHLPSSPLSDDESDWNRRRRPSPPRRSVPTMHPRTELQASRHPSVLTSMASSRNTHKIKDAPIFTGASEKGDTPFYEWETKLLAKLKAEYQDDTEEDKLDYLLTRTSGTAFNRIRNRIGERAVHAYQTVKDCLTDLENSYGEFNQKTKSLSKFTALTQGKSETFGAFWAKFQEYRVHLNMSEEDEIEHLTSKLNPRLRTKIVGVDFDSVTSLVKRCQKLEGQLDVLDAQSPRENTTRSSRPMQNTSGSNRSYNQSSALRSNNRDGSTVAISVPSAAGKNPFKGMKKLTEAERTQLRNDNACFRCRKVGHVALDCPLRRDNTSAQSASLNQVSTEPTEMLEKAGTSQSEN